MKVVSASQQEPTKIILSLEDKGVNNNKQQNAAENQGEEQIG